MFNVPDWFVIVMGLGTVFLGLCSIILLCKILGALCSLLEKKDSTPETKIQSNSQPAAPIAQSMSQAKRQELIAAIATVISEECGVDAKNIRIHSIKRI